MLKNDVRKELIDHILPFWLKLKDEIYGGAYGEVSSHDLSINKKADKGVIYHSRLLWTYASAYQQIPDKLYLQYAKEIYQFLKDHAFDNEFGGVYWMLDYKGNVVDSSKHVYNQAFAIYGLSEYYKISKDQEVLNFAIDLYNLLEKVGFNHESNAYYEEFNQKWELQSNEKLSESGVIADITMNTHLHLIEAYTNLYSVWPDKLLKEKIVRLLDIFNDWIISDETGHLKVFLDNAWKELKVIQSYGHDIEASWLLDETIEIVPIDKERKQKTLKNTLRLLDNVVKKAILDNGIVIDEQIDGIKNDEAIWWVQAEAIVGLINGYHKTNHTLYLDLANKIWDFTKENIIDTRNGSEWFWSINLEGNYSPRGIAEPWKSSYHNARFCIELIKRSASYDK